MRSRLPLSKVYEGYPGVSEPAILFDCLSAVARMTKPMQVACIIGAASVAGYLVVKVKAALVWPSASRARRVRRRRSQGYPIGAIAPSARAGPCYLPTLLTRA